MKNEIQSERLMAAADPFIRIVAISDALAMKTDDIPLSRHMPGTWPTLGELRRLVCEIKHTCEQLNSTRRDA
ncbi:MAG TPA: hypothetical protein VHG89_03755 [Verrucomicrobiae bacterium]|nr:hypothetical protein [Verrucomicrobiae bacterium]